MAIKGSSSDEEEEDARSSSNDKKEPMNPNLYKQVKKMNKCLKKINSMGYVVFLKDGHHHQLMRVEKRFKKKQQKKEKKPKYESFAILVNELVVVKNQAQAQVMNQKKNSPHAPIWGHHQTLPYGPRYGKRCK